MRSHNQRVLLSLSYSPTHISQYLHGCRLLWHVLVITALVPSYIENLKTSTPFRVTLLNTQSPTHPCTSSVFSMSHKTPFLCALCLSLTHTQTQADSEREEDRWHISWGEAANVICYNSALISVFSNLLRDLYVLPERASILTEPWPAPTVPVSHDRCFPWPPDIFGGHMGPCQAWLILHSKLHHY